MLFTIIHVAFLLVLNPLWFERQVFTMSSRIIRVYFISVQTTTKQFNCDLVKVAMTISMLLSCNMGFQVPQSLKAG